MSEEKESVSVPSAHTNGKNPWNPMTIGFNTFGIVLGLCLVVFGGTRAFWMVDSFWVRYVGDTRAYVVDIQKKVNGSGDASFGVVLALDKKGSYPETKILVFNDKLYNYVKNQYHPPRRLRLSALRVQRVLSGQAGVAQVGPLRLLNPPKSTEMIIFMCLLGMGMGVIFTSSRSLRRRWLRRGLNV